MTGLFDFDTPPFDLLNPQQQALVNNHLEIAYYNKGDTILKAGERTDRFYVVHKGLIDETLSGEHFALYCANDFFDIKALFSSHCKHDYVCQEETITLELPVQLIKDIGKTLPEFLNRFKASLASKQEIWHRRQQGQNLSEFMLNRITRDHCEPVAILEPDTTIMEAVQAMKASGSDSVIIVKNNQPGVVTRTDLLEGLTLGKLLPDHPASGLASTPLITASIDDFLFDAMILMTRHKIERVIVLNKGLTLPENQENIVGTLPLTRVLSLFSTHSHVMALRIQHADHFSSLQECAASIDALIGNLHNNGVRIPFLMKLVSALNEQIIQRLYQLHFNEAFQHHSCLMVMGSEGRGEQMMKTDQDNGLILDPDWCPPENPKTQLEQFSEKLQGLGYPPCPGHIMVSNPKWVTNTHEWRNRLEYLRASGSTESLMELAILLDARPIAGNPDLFKQISASIHKPQEGSSRLAAQFAMPALQFRTPLGLLGGIQASNNWIDVKKGGLFPIIHGVRSLALEFGLQPTSTLERLQLLTENGVVEPQLSENLNEAFCLFHRLKLDRLLQSTDTSDNRVDITTLSRCDRDLLRHGLHTVKKFKQFLWRHFHLERF